MFQANSSIPVFLQVSVVILLLTLLSTSIYYLIYIGNRHVSADKRININWKNIFKVILIVIGISLVVALFRAFPVLGSTLSSFLIAILLAYLLNPLVNKFEKLGLKRNFGTALVYIIVLLVFVGLGFLVIPALVNQIQNFVKNLPRITNYSLNWLKEMLENNNINNTELYYQVEEAVKNYISTSSTKVLTWSAGALSSVSASIGFLVYLVLIPIISFFLLTDKEKIFTNVKKFFPKKYYAEANKLYHEIDDSMSNFVRGRILMAVFVGIVTMIVLLIMGIDFAVVIGLITMIADIIPYVGPFIGFLPAAVFALMESPMKVVWLAIIFFIINWIENNILGPKLLGESTGIHPLVILISIIIGGGMFGVWGMILSVPFVSLIMILTKFITKKSKA
ncbi:MAG: AI-2E family transporter [Tissierellia bacterium]|nr:AI-2E family transporter [Tissierellia bacterium]